MSNELKKFAYAGIKDIYIPLKTKELNQKNIADHLSYILNQHKQNKNKIDYFQKVYSGDIDTFVKTRPYIDTIDNDNKVLENHAFSQVEFKTSSMIGEPIQYTQKDSLKTDEITYLNAYNSDIYKSEVDNETVTNVYITGIGYQLVLPKDTDYDIEYESPYKVISCDPTKTCVVKSSYSTDEILFGCSFLEFLDKDQKTVKQVIIYSKRYIYTYDITSIVNAFLISPPVENAMNEVPLIDFYRNKDHIGIVELCYSLYHAINLVSSTSMDNLIDVANCLLVFVNQDITADKLAQSRKMGALIITSDNKEAPADVKQLVLQLQHQDVQVFYERLVKACYDIASVPQSSSNVTSGGDTGQARLLGQGWSKHYNSLKTDCTYVSKGLRRVMKLILKICNSLSTCPINKLYASDIDIKFNINMTDNMLVKTQSLQTLLNLNFGTETALNMVELTNDSHAVAIERDAIVANIKVENEVNEEKINIDSSEDIIDS